jgi:SET domain-containing protein
MLIETKKSFVIFKTDDDRGWGLKSLKPIPKGTPVIEYVGEMIGQKGYHEREEGQEENGLLYGLELTQETEDDPFLCQIKN